MEEPEAQGSTKGRASLDRGLNMAESLAHSFGQIIGSVLEDAILPDLEKFAGTHGLYLDKKGPRKARKGRKVSWTDQFGNTHDLDFVLQTDDLESTFGLHFSDNGHDFRCADIKTDNQIFAFLDFTHLKIPPIS